MKVYIDCPTCGGRGYVKMKCPSHCENEGKCDTVCVTCSDASGKVPVEITALLRLEDGKPVARVWAGTELIWFGSL